MNILDIIEEFKEKIKDEFGELVCKFYLFGEYARGNYKEYPSVKIALIVKRKMIRSEWEKVESIASEMCEKYGGPFYVFEIELEKFESEKSPLAKIVKREGFEIM